MALGHKTGGRKKGTPNRVTAQKRAEIEAKGITPLDYMLERMRDENAADDLRLEAAKAAAPYVHPRLSTIEANVNHDLSDPLKDLFASIAERGKRLGK